MNYELCGGGGGYLINDSFLLMQLSAFFVGRVQLEHRLIDLWQKGVCLKVWGTYLCQIDRATPFVLQSFSEYLLSPNDEDVFDLQKANV